MRWTLALLASLAVLVILGPGALAAQQEATVEVSLDEAVRRALQVQPAMVQAQGDRRAASADKRAAFGAYLPTVTTSWSASRSNVSRIDGTTGQPVAPEYTHTAGINASILLFDALGRYSNARATSAQLHAADAGYVSERFQVTLQTKQVFYGALAAEALVAVSQAQVRRAEQQLQIAIEKLRAGSATRSDSLRSTVEYGNARLDLLNAIANHATAQANLGRQVGLDVPVRAAVSDTALPAFPDTLELRAAALDNAPLVQETEATARAARANVWGPRSSYFPSVSLTYSDNLQGSATRPTDRTYNWRFGLSWTIFNGFNRESQNVAASATRDVAEARAQDARRQVNAQLTQQMAALGTTWAQIDIAGSNLAAAREDLRVQQERYRVGASTILDLLVSQAALTNAEVNLIQTKFNYVIARAQLEATVGRTL